MAKTIVGLFENFTDAQSVVRELVDQGFPREDISIAANNAAGEYSEYTATGQGAVDTDQMSGAAAGAGTGAVVGGLGGLLVGLGALAIPGIGPVVAAGPLLTTLAGAGIGAAAGGLIGALVDVGVPEEEAGYYAEGVRRGGTLVTVRADDHGVDRAVAVMERHNAVDVDQRAAYWRQGGWTGYTPEARPYTAEEIGRERDLYRNTPGVERAGASAAATGAQAAAQSHAPRGTSPVSGEETTIPVVEEDVRVGKRAVERPVRVYTRVTEKPVEEHVQLREERVRVERRPADRPASTADRDAFREGTIEVTETREEPVVAKQARVVEEVAVRKDVGERTETVRDTARRTDVEVEQAGAERGTGPGGFETHAPDFRTHFRTTFGNRPGVTYEKYEPAYRYGSTLATDTRYAGKEWTAFESEARRDWEARNQGAWEDVKDAVRYAWDKVRGRAPRAA
jgi:stress response protein YsnF